MSYRQLEEGEPLEEKFEPGNPDFVTPPWEKCDICGAEPMTANCNNAACDTPKRYVGDKPKVKHTKDYATMARGRGWPYERDYIDYDPSTDEDLEEWQEQGED